MIVETTSANDCEPPSIFVPDSPPQTNRPSLKTNSSTLSIVVDDFQITNLDQDNNEQKNKKRMKTSSSFISTPTLRHVDLLDNLINSQTDRICKRNIESCLQSQQCSVVVDKCEEKKPDDMITSNVDDATTCPICLESWTSSGSHRVCCLKCGHLFGKSCIERWLMKSSRKCPTCNAISKKQDIRFLYATKISVVDSQELEFTLKQLKKEQRERSKLETEKSKALLEYKILKDQYQLLQRDFSDLQRILCEQFKVSNRDLSGLCESKIGCQHEKHSIVTSSSSQIKPDDEMQLPPSPISIAIPEKASEIAASTSMTFADHPLITTTTRTTTTTTTTVTSAKGYFSSNSVLSSLPSVPFSQSCGGMEHKYRLQDNIPTEGARVLDWCSRQALLVISSSRNVSYGITKISALDSRHVDYIELHRKPVRDVKFSKHHDDLLLTASMDNSLKLVNTKSNNIVLSYSLENPSWSCDWNHDDSNYIYCGQNRCILMFDIRKTDTFVRKLTGLQEQPIHSLLYISSSLSTFGQSGIMTGSCSGICFWNASRDYECSQLAALEGICTSVSFDPLSRYFLASFRHTPTFSKPIHKVFQQTAPSERQELQTLYTVNANALVQHQMLSRSTLFSLSTENLSMPSPMPRRLVVAANDESNFSVSHSLNSNKC